MTEDDVLTSLPGTDSTRADLTFRGVGKRYTTRDGWVEALDDVSFSVQHAEFVSLIGRSGCGKSTLLKMAAGVISETSGEIIHARRPQLPTAQAALGMVFQSPVLLDWRTVLDNVLLPLEIHGRVTAEHRRRALELLDMVHLGDFVNRYPWQLSGGMQQRASICRALVLDPQLLLMDEPFGALDALTRDELGLELLRIWEETKKTVLFVTHSIEEAVFLSDRVVVLTPRPGRVDAILEINLDRPRDLDVRYGEKFAGYCKHLRGVLDRRA